MIETFYIFIFLEFFMVLMAQAIEFNIMSKYKLELK